MNIIQQAGVCRVCPDSTLGSPDEVPPPVHFKIHKLPDSIPQSAHGFHATEFDPYLLDAVTTYDNWEYKYIPTQIV